MISLRSGLCILASTGVSLQKVVPLGIHTNVNTYAAVSYWSCFVFFCRRFLAFLYHPFPFSIVRRSFSSSSVCLLFPVCWPVPYVSCSGYGLVPVLSISCSISFHACSIQISFFRFVVVHSSQVHLVWLYDHHLRRVLVASNRPPFVLIRSYIWIQAALLRIAAPAKLSHVILRALPRFRYFPHAIPGVWSATIINHDYTPIIMRAQLRTYSLLNSLIHLLLSSLCSQSATCSFLFRVILLLAVVN